MLAARARRACRGLTRIPAKGTLAVGEPLGIDFEEHDRAGIVTLNRARHGLTR